MPSKFLKSACIEYENIRRNFIAFGSKENSETTLPLKNAIKWSYLAPDAGSKVNR